jgi:hypothetical protein
MLIIVPVKVNIEHEAVACHSLLVPDPPRCAAFAKAIS